MFVYAVMKASVTKGSCYRGVSYVLSSILSPRDTNLLPSILSFLLVSRERQRRPSVTGSK